MVKELGKCPVTSGEGDCRVKDPSGAEGGTVTRGSDCLLKHSSVLKP